MFEGVDYVINVADMTLRSKTRVERTSACLLLLYSHCPCDFVLENDQGKAFLSVLRPWDPRGSRDPHAQVTPF